MLDHALIIGVGELTVGAGLVMADGCGDCDTKGCGDGDTKGCVDWTVTVEVGGVF